MDYKKHQSLEKLYNYFSSNNNPTIDAIVEIFDIEKHVVLSLISELSFMGLNISIKADKLKLLNKIDFYNIKKIVDLKINSKEIIYKFSTDSTNKQAQENPKDCIFIADYQSQGKGRQAKKWLTPVGQSIALSISHRFNFGLQQLSGLNIAIGVAIIQTLKQYNAPDIGLKWPNDVNNLEGKIAGILIEVSGNSNQCRAIIGIGLNWNIWPELFKQIDQPISNSGIVGTTRTQFVTSLMFKIEDILNEFAENNLNQIKTEWDKYDLYVNKKIDLIQAGKNTSAIYKGINTKGLLTVKVGNQIKTVASGEVSVRLTNGQIA